LSTQERELLNVSPYGKLREAPPEPWAYDIDEHSSSSIAAGLRILWDTSETA
jgi:hypothetical protein